MAIPKSNLLVLNIITQNIHIAHKQVHSISEIALPHRTIRLPI